MLPQAYRVYPFPEVHYRSTTLHGNSVFSLFLPIERIVSKTLFPHHGGNGPGHEVGVIFGTIAHKMTKSQLPGL